MAGVTADGFWSDPKMVKTLILEHHMAAKRMGFLDIFEPLYQIDEFRTGLLDGTLPLMRLFSSSVLPLITRKQLGDEFGVAAIVRRASPLLGHAALRGASVDQPAQISKAKAAVEALPKLWSEGTVPRLRDVLQSVACTSLFEVPESLQPFVPGGSGPTDVGDEGEVELAALDSEVVAAIHSFLDASFDQVAPYAEYVAGGAPFATHQGIKGREFPRVMVVLDDGEARGFMFSYERLFQVKDKTAADIGNERAGNETGIDRTRRLFYVTCSRSQSSLAIVAYSSNPSKVRDFVLREQWFEEREIELVD